MVRISTPNTCDVAEPSLSECPLDVPWIGRITCNGLDSTSGDSDATNRASVCYVEIGTVSPKIDRCIKPCRCSNTVLRAAKSSRPGNSCHFTCRDDDLAHGVVQAVTDVKIRTIAPNTMWRLKCCSSTYTVR